MLTSRGKDEKSAFLCKTSCQSETNSAGSARDPGDFTGEIARGETKIVGVEITVGSEKVDYVTKKKEGYDRDDEDVDTDN